jgi:hypothetical protein
MQLRIWGQHSTIPELRELETKQFGDILIWDAVSV